MRNIVILHGTLGSPEGSWFRWLEAELQQRGCTVWLPQLPHPEQPSLAASAEFVRAHCPFPLNEETLLIGHSSGAILALILAQQNKTRLGGVVAVSVFHDNSLQWEPNNHLFDVPFDWEAIRAHMAKHLFIHSDNDPYVPLEQAEFVAKNCHVQLQVIPGQGHFNLEASPKYRAFPKLLALLQQEGLLA